MPQLGWRFVSATLYIACSFAQDGVSEGELRLKPGAQIPTLDSVNRSKSSTSVSTSYHPGFLKNLTVDSFGYNLAPVGPGFESPTRLSAGPYTQSGFECPRCIIAPAMARMRYTLPPFGSTVTLRLFNGRGELYTRMGGTDAWKPDTSIIDVDGNGLRRNSSFNDAWLAQGVVGAKVAVDRDRHLWLGVASRYLQNFGPGRRHWNTVEGNATFQFGR